MVLFCLFVWFCFLSGYFYFFIFVLLFFCGFLFFIFLVCFVCLFVCVFKHSTNDEIYIFISRILGNRPHYGITKD